MIQHEIKFENMLNEIGQTQKEQTLYDATYMSYLKQANTQKGTVDQS